MVINVPGLRAYWGWQGPGLWFGIEPISAGVFGISAGVLVTLLVSVLTRSSTQNP